MPSAYPPLRGCCGKSASSGSHLAAKLSCSIIVKGYHEFGAENTFEGNVVAVSFKF
ncbi:MAG: hypothetical protein ACSLE4_03575 [Methyloceanibacter sp.]|uniref:hypothetical protein n=1 Tax=Methyloceanibacter sp. TaxID=1965321 RepID=UPI003EE340C9